MERDVHLDGPPAELLAVAETVVPAWLRRLVVDSATAAGVDPALAEPAIDAMVSETSTDLLAALAALLATDVDRQRTNPLSMFRAAVAAPTAVLRELDVPPPASDRFDADAFPDDLYRLGPATWSDVDPALHEPGIAWGAWKAMVVLRRRRDEGVR